MQDQLQQIEENKLLIEKAKAVYKRNNEILDQWEATKRIVGITPEKIREILEQEKNNPLVEKYLNMDASDVNYEELISDFRTEYGDKIDLSSFEHFERRQDTPVSSTNTDKKLSENFSLGNVAKNKKGPKRIFL
jgi:hypothetical protein